MRREEVKRTIPISFGKSVSLPFSVFARTGEARSTSQQQNACTPEATGLISLYTNRLSILTVLFKPSLNALNPLHRAGKALFSGT
jgi:hypothetical protein